MLSVQVAQVVAQVVARLPVCAESRKRVRAIVAETLGESWREAEMIRFDVGLARDGRRLFDTRKVPSVDPRIPPQVSRVRFVVDLGEPTCLDQVEAAHALLRERRVTLTDRWEEPEGPPDAEGEGDPFAIRLPALLLASKADQLAAPEEELRVFLEVTGLRYPAFAVSASREKPDGALTRRTRCPGLTCRLDVSDIPEMISGMPHDRPGVA